VRPETRNDDSASRQFCIEFNRKLYLGNSILSCQDIKELEASSARCEGQPGAHEKRFEYLREKSAESQLQEPIRHCYSNKLYYELGDQPDGLHSGTETPEAFAARIKTSNVKELQCLGDNQRAKTLEELMDVVVKESATLRTNEAECRKSKKCIERRQNIRAGENICTNVANIRLAQDQMRAERANPSGVVNLAVLHDAGEMMQMSKAQLREEKAEFRKKYGREFPDSVCKEVWAQPDETALGDPRTTCNPRAGTN
jgi:hypothetical protein